MPGYAALDRLHARVVRVPALQYFTAVTRVLLAIGFLPSGLKKVVNVRFTQLPTTTSVGFFFEAFYQSGVWYQFVGFAQVLAAVLLLVPRTAALGALLYFPIIVNVALVTIGVGFQGTPFVTVAMSFASLYLVCWEYDKWRALLPTWGPSDATPADAFGGRLYALAILGWGAAGAVAFTAARLIGLANLDRMAWSRGLPLLFAMGAGFGLVTAWQARRIAASPRANATGR